jgi:hypothetical protein
VFEYDTFKYLKTVMVLLFRQFGILHVPALCGIVAIFVYLAVYAGYPLT